MKFDDQNIDLKEIQHYLNGELRGAEKHVFEMKMENDPFLYEAVEGYQNNPEALARISKLKKDHRASRNSFFGSRTLAIIGVVGLVYVIALIINGAKDDSSNSNEMVQTNEPQEVEIVPESIDSFQLADVSEQITIKEIVVNKQMMEEVISDEMQHSNDIITIEEDPVIDIDQEITPEVDSKKRTIYAPSIYYFDLYVVDYREIERKNTTINYTRYELSGLSAEFENQDSKENQELIEKKVEVPYMEYLETSMDYFSVGSYKKALNRYLTILQQYPDDLNAHFYGGHCYFNLKKYQEALAFFEIVLEDEKKMNFVAFRQEAKWYKAKTLIKLGQKDKAKTILDEIIAEGLFYTKEAIELKEKL
ncbi:MAG: tetratricopeptide repeat protein [Crocinitomicaceae bacterium]